MMFRTALTAIALAGVLTQIQPANAQVLLSGGLTYSQNFDSLSNSPANSNPTWTDNATVGLVGWYASRAFTAGTTSTYGPYAYTSYRVSDGTTTSGLLYSYGVAGVNPITDRGLGSLGSGTPKTNSFGVRISNDNAYSVNNVTISYTGEQWRNGGNTASNRLAFSYQVSSTPFASPISVDVNGAGWVNFSALDFVSLINTATAATLDGNAPANRTLFSSVLLSGVTLTPGQEIFLRWLDIDEGGSDHGMAVDDFSISFSAVPEPATAALVGLGLLGFILSRRNRS
jgi:hypothetical protein